MTIIAPSPTSSAAATPSGLDQVVAAETRLSHVDGVAGRLILRGHDLADLADWRFEAVLALLWADLAPGALDAAAVTQMLGHARPVAFALLPGLLPATDGLSEVEALRLLLAALPDETDVPHHSLAIAATPVFAAAIARRRRGLSPVAPTPHLGLAADFLRMLHGQEGTQEKVRGLETFLVTVADHGLNASTFAARVIASTKAGLLSAVLAGLCALKGPLHGGAPGPVLDMLDAIDGEADILPWLTAALDRGERLMGFGHRIYRVRDPRADVLKRAVSTLSATDDRIRFAQSVERQALALLTARKPERALQTNVEFYTALLLEALGFSRESFTNVFAAGRMAGWTAHVLEQDKTGRLIRPQSLYIGPWPEGAAV